MVILSLKRNGKLWWLRIAKRIEPWRLAKMLYCRRVYERGQTLLNGFEEDISLLGILIQKLVLVNCNELDSLSQR